MDFNRESESLKIWQRHVSEKMSFWSIFLKKINDSFCVSLNRAHDNSWLAKLILCSPKWTHFWHKSEFFLQKKHAFFEEKNSFSKKMMLNYAIQQVTETHWKIIASIVWDGFTEEKTWWSVIFTHTWKSWISSKSCSKWVERCCEDFTWLWVRFPKWRSTGRTDLHRFASRVFAKTLQKWA